MNLTRLSILFVLIVAPFMLVSYVDTLALQKKTQTRQQYTRTIHNAVDDGAAIISSTISVAGGDAYELTVKADEVIDTFLASYYLGFNAHSITDRVRLDRYVVAVLVTDYDGFYIYGIREVTDDTGSMVMTHVLSEKQPYAYEDSTHLIHVTLGDRLKILEKSTMAESGGTAATIITLPSSVPTSDYDRWRRQVVTDSVTSALEQTVSLHNRYGSALGLAYDFQIPLGDRNALAQALTGPGIMAFVQGQPLGGGQYLEVMTFSQGSVAVAEEVTGHQDGVTGDFYYCDGSCSHPVADPEVKRFSSAREAASEGYYPCHMLGK